MSAVEHKAARLRGRWYPRQVAAAQRWVTKAHILLFRASRGRIGGRLLGCPVLLLTTIGWRSGRLRTVPLFYLPDGETLVLVASNGGTATDPLWYRNLQQHPFAMIERGGAQRVVAVRTASAAERERLWPRLVNMYPPYAAYQARTARPIPLVLLEPLEAV